MELRVLGLSESSLEVYRRLIDSQSGTVDDLVAAGSDREDVLRDLVVLEAQGLVSRRVGDGDEYVAARPSVALGAVVADAQDRVRRTEVLVGELEELYGATRHGRSPADLVDIVLGADAVRARLRQIQASARSEVLSLVKAPVAVVSSEENTAEDAAVARGVRYRAVLERAMLEEEPRLYDEILRVQGLGEEARLATSVPIKLFIVDRSIALVPLGPGPSSVEGALLVRKCGLLDALVALFESVWADAFDIVPTDGSPADRVPDETDLRILALLLTGLTDQAVAGALRTSVRTVQRRVRALMDEAGVTTRLQLGAAAVRHGWSSTGP